MNCCSSPTIKCFPRRLRALTRVFNTSDVLPPTNSMLRIQSQSQVQEVQKMNTERINETDRALTRKVAKFEHSQEISICHLLIGDFLSRSPCFFIVAIFAMFFNTTNYCPDGPDTGDTAWVIVASVLVLGMMPGLALFEIGLLRAKNSVSVMLQIMGGIMVPDLF